MYRCYTTGAHNIRIFISFDFSQKYELLNLLLFIFYFLFFWFAKIRIFCVWWNYAYAWLPNSSYGFHSASSSFFSFPMIFFWFSSTTNKLIFGTAPSFERQPVFQRKLLLYCCDVAFIKCWRLMIKTLDLHLHVPSLAIHDQSPSPLIFESLSGGRVEVRCTAVKCIALCDKFVSHLWKKKGIYSDSR